MIRVRADVPAGSPERGRIMPTAPSTIEPLTPLSPLPLPPCRRAFTRAVRTGGSRQDSRGHRSVKRGGSWSLGCLPSAGTLHRIRWPLQPRPQDRPRTLAGIWTTREWCSHTTLGLRRSTTVFTVLSDVRSTLRSIRSPTCDRRRSFRARSPFTRRHSFSE